MFTAGSAPDPRRMSRTRLLEREYDPVAVHESAPAPALLSLSPSNLGLARIAAAAEPAARFRMPLAPPAGATLARKGGKGKGGWEDRAKEFGEHVPEGLRDPLQKAGAAIDCGQRSAGVKAELRSAGKGAVEGAKESFGEGGSDLTTSALEGTARKGGLVGSEVALSALKVKAANGDKPAQEALDRLAKDPEGCGHFGSGATGPVPVGGFYGLGDRHTAPGESPVDKQREQADKNTEENNKEKEQHEASMKDIEENAKRKQSEQEDAQARDQANRGEVPQSPPSPDEKQPGGVADENSRAADGDRQDAPADPAAQAELDQGQADGQKQIDDATMQSAEPEKSDDDKQIESDVAKLDDPAAVGADQSGGGGEAETGSGGGE